MTESAFGLLGIPSEAERLYRPMLRVGHASAAELAVELSLGPTAVARAAAQPRQAGLVAFLADGEYAPVDPRAGLRALTDRHTAELERIREEVPLLVQLFDTIGVGSSTGDGTTVLSDREVIAATYVRMQHLAREQFLAFDRPPYLSATANPLQPAVLARGVRWRAVYAGASFDIPGAWEEVRGLAERGEEARVVPDLPIKLAIADHDLAILGLRLDTGGVETLRTDSRPLINALCDLFEAHWQKGTPVGDPVGTSPAASGDVRFATSPERALLALIGAGLKDEVIARQLGISPRTLRRRTQELMSELGAANRFQAGAEAARRGWL
ncbi:helix-turn-helix domain-containing protein [Lapillicoccus sp.]|uniref:helix-turn-helix transcriptional regulator n=1 Tax=Lapillicoccus sp. TaxID=1909287 RepID=UPI0025D7ACBF|nr:helix-turn-helix domain-containing protein [Lapillicoccus sp.]